MAKDSEPVVSLSCSPPTPPTPNASVHPPRTSSDPCSLCYGLTERPGLLIHAIYAVDVLVQLRRPFSSESLAVRCDRISRYRFGSQPGTRKALSLFGVALLPTAACCACTRYHSSSTFSVLFSTERLLAGVSHALRLSNQFPADKEGRDCKGSLLSTLMPGGLHALPLQQRSPNLNKTRLSTSSLACPLLEVGSSRVS